MFIEYYLRRYSIEWKNCAWGCIFIVESRTPISVVPLETSSGLNVNCSIFFSFTYYLAFLLSVFGNKLMHDFWVYGSKMIYFITYLFITCSAIIYLNLNLVLCVPDIILTLEKPQNKVPPLIARPLRPYLPTSELFSNIFFL